MRALVLSAVDTTNEVMGGLLAAVEKALWRKHSEVKKIDLTQTRLAFCQGEFDCWVRTPGRCKAQDAEVEIVQAIHDADTVVSVGPVCFGGYGYTLKRAFDRAICLIEPFFVRRLELTHHEGRYARYAKLFSVGWIPKPSAGVEHTFRELNDANAINLMAPACGSLVLSGPPCSTWDDSLQEMLLRAKKPGERISSKVELRAQLLAAAEGEDSRSEPVKSASILIGSAKPEGSSASEVLARGVSRRLEAHGLAPRVHFAKEFVHDNEGARASAKAIEGTELFVLVTPLYVDSLPALVTHGLEMISRARAGDGQKSFAMIVNCGFPEPEHIRTALRIGRHFADESGYGWLGGLPLGGGGVIDPKRSLEEQGGPVTHVSRALELATPALASGHSVPREAIELMAKPGIPDAVYRFLGDVGWRWQAYVNHVPQRELRARPLDLSKEPGS